MQKQGLARLLHVEESDLHPWMSTRWEVTIHREPTMSRLGEKGHCKNKQNQNKQCKEQTKEEEISRVSTLYSVFFRRFFLLEFTGTH